MKAEELRKLTIEDLNIELHALLRAQFGLRMQLATQQISNTNQLRTVKKNIARVKTIITQKNSENKEI